MLILDGGPLAEMAGPDEAELRVLAVAPEHQRGGVGRTLVRACINAAVERGRTRIVCSCLASMEPAQRLYARMGFRRVPERAYAIFPGFDRQALVRTSAGARRAAERPSRRGHSSGRAVSAGPRRPRGGRGAGTRIRGR
jgi:ribosomal protein S18 acetylase RimI-like enzyme